MEENIHYCEDQDLGRLLYGFFSQGHESVEIRHPTEGVKIYTREDYVKSLKQVHNKRTGGSKEKARRVKQMENRAIKMQIRFRTALISADVREVDIENDGNFGKDTKGYDIDMEGMIFTGIDKYPKGIDLVDKEVGCLVDEAMKKPPIRIVSG